MKDDRLYLIHIWECIQRIESYAIEGKSAFLASNMIQDAIIRNFEVIGEAAKHLSSELKQSHPEIQWRGLAGFRDVLIHNYMGVDSEEVWNIIENDLPQIKSSLKSFLVKLRLLP
jgi:uncharacterized protein with HEPN domain